MNKEMVIFTVFLILIVLAGIFIKTPVDKKTPVQEPNTAGIFIEFEEGTTEPEVKAILENYNLTRNYSLEYYNRGVMPSRY
jgi:cell division protein YceG involved in septum cleavage